MILTVYSKKGEPLFSGTKQDCKHFIKRRAYKRGEVTIGNSRTNVEEPMIATIETTAPIEPKPKGFIKRIFSRT